MLEKQVEQYIAIRRSMGYTCGFDYHMLKKHLVDIYASLRLAAP